MAAKYNGYQFGVEWIALNDEPTWSDSENVAGMISVCLLADLTNRKPETVAADVIRFRETHSSFAGDREAGVRYG